MTERRDRETPPEERRRIRRWHAKDAADATEILSTHNRAGRLSRLVPLWPSEIEAEDAAAAERIVAALERALRGERRRGRAGHWTYDMNRHVALARALREERARLARLRENETDPAKARQRGSTRTPETKSLPLHAISGNAR